MILVFIPALLILAALGAYTIITATFSPWHWLLIAAEFGAVVLLFRLVWILIGNLREKIPVIRHLRALRRRAVRMAAAAYRWCGPVAGAIQGELSKEERVRAISKAVLFGFTSGTTLLATLKQPDTLTEVVVPLVTAALAGALDAAFHHQTGTERTAP